jgi:hypothetical protein
VEDVSAGVLVLCRNLLTGGFGIQQRLQLRERGVDHLLGFGSLSAFRERLLGAPHDPG